MTRVLLFFVGLALVACGEKKSSELKSGNEYWCSNHCSFVESIGNRSQVQAFDNVAEYLEKDSDSSILQRYGFYVKHDDQPSGLAERKERLHEAIVRVVGDDENKIALMLIMAMAETYEMRGWDTIKDSATDGSRNFTIFNMNEDYLNSIRHDLNHNPLAFEKGLSDPMGDIWDWSVFNQNEGWGELDKQVYLLNASLELWGVTNVLTIHRYGYHGVEGKAFDPLTLIYVDGVREGVKWLLENPEYFRPGGSKMGHRVAGNIPHI